MNKNVNTFFDLLNQIGIPLYPDSPPLLIFAFSIFFLAILCLISAFFIILYLISIYITQHDYLLSRLSNKPRLLKFIKYYRNIRIIYLSLEIIFFL